MRDTFAGTELAVRCYESHPVLKVGKGTLYGGSASDPAVKDADVYVSLQRGSTSGRASDPWEAHTVVEVHYSIQDMDAPPQTARFKKLVTWLCTQLHDGKKVHVGCMGGHGRTGVVLSAIVAEALEKADAIQYVRKHYCKKAVESKAQVAFLVKHYGVTSVSPTKETYQPKPNGKTYELWDRSAVGYGVSSFEHTQGLKEKAQTKRVLLPEGVSQGAKSYAPLPSSGRSLWRKLKGERG